MESGADAILITVDVASLGKREADSRILPSSTHSKTPKKDGGIASTTASLLDGPFLTACASSH